MKHLYQDKHMGTFLALLFFGMIVCGAVYINVFAYDNQAFLIKFSVHQKDISVLTDMDWKVLFSQIFFMRIFQILMLFILVYFLGAKWVIYTVTGLAGIILGIVVAVETMMLGAAGMMYGIIIWLPQTVCYGVIYEMLYLQAKSGNAFHTSWSIRKKKILFSEKETTYMRKCVSGILLKLVLVVTLAALGSLLEAYANPRLLLFCNQHIVSAIIS